MPSTFRTALWGFGLLASVSFAAGCSQGEGGRCQITSDCASGLVCTGSNSQGNGTCSKVASTVNDAAVASAEDAPTSGAPDATAQAVDSEPEGIDAQPTVDAELATVDSEAAGIDAQPTVDAEPATVDGARTAIDAPSLSPDTGAATPPASVDGAIGDSSASEAGAID